MVGVHNMVFLAWSSYCIIGLINTKRLIFKTLSISDKNITEKHLI